MCLFGFSANLDLLIWVTSPEKYADRRMYELLAAALSQAVHHLKQERPTCWERLGRDALTPSRDALPLSGPAAMVTLQGIFVEAVPCAAHENSA